jgi:ABC-type branched-subunit amino acid transport system ATPase component
VAVTPGEPLLSVRGVSKQFGGLWALRGVSLAVGRGEIRGLIGPNGAGKTTLLNVAAGMMAPTAGVVEIDGQAVTGRRPHEVAALGIARTFQHVMLFGGMTALENVLVGFHRRVTGPLASPDRTRLSEAGARQAAIELLRRFDLERAADQEVGKLSIATRKRLELVRVLALRPTLLFLDEPAAGLSSTEMQDLIGILRSLRDDDGITIVLVEHIMDLIMGVCDRLTVLSFGEVLAEGTPVDIRSNASVIEAYLGTQPA